MDWSRVVEALIGTFAGGSIALGSWWLKEAFDRRQAAQAWFEQYFLADGLDALRSYLMVVELRLPVLAEPVATSVTTIVSLPPPFTARLP